MNYLILKKHKIYKLKIKLIFKNEKYFFLTIYKITYFKFFSAIYYNTF